MQRYFLSGLMILFIILGGCSTNNNANDPGKEKVELTISAAASLKDAMEDIKKAYQEQHTNVYLRMNYGGSGSLQQQIEQGAPVDLFFSAAEDKFTPLVDRDLISEQDGQNLLENELVLIVPKENQYDIASFEDLIHKEVDPISIGTPETVPAGKYAKETLASLGVWQDVESKMVYAKDVRQVLSYVETGNVAAGIVYKTDALLSDDVTIVATADSTSHSPIQYPVGIIKSSNQYKAAKSFYQYLHSEKALEVFKNYGFITK